MQNSISKQIIENWIARLSNEGIDQCVVESLSELSQTGTLINKEKLITSIDNLEGHYAKNKIVNG